MEKNSIELINPTGNELSDDELILPRKLAELYNVVNGKFYHKKSGVLAFELIGNKLVLRNDNQSS